MAGLSVWYDRDGDVLEVTFEDAAAAMEEIADDIFARRTPDGRIIGFIVLNFSHHDRDDLRLPLAVTARAASL
jgi:uncharacterized protein YuzE